MSPTWITKILVDEIVSEMSLSDAVSVANLSDEDIEILQTAIIDAIPCVHDVHHVHVWSLTPEHPLLTLHVNVDPDTDSTKVLQRVKKVLEERFQIHHSTIQVEPAHCVDEHTESISSAQE